MAVILSLAGFGLIWSASASILAIERYRTHGVFEPEWKLGLVVTWVVLVAILMF